MFTSVDDFLKACRDKANQEYTRLQKAKMESPSNSPIIGAIEKALNQIGVISDSFPELTRKANNEGVGFQSILLNEITPPSGVDPIDWTNRRITYHRAMTVAFESQLKALTAEQIRKKTPKEEQ